MAKTTPLTGRPYEDAVDERVLGPAGLDACNLVYRMSGDFYDAHHERIGVSASRATGVHVPHLVEESREMATEWNPSWSGFATARGLARLFKYQLDLVDGRATNELLPRRIIEELLTPRANEPDGRHLTGQVQLMRIERLVAAIYADITGDDGVGSATFEV